MDEMDEPPRVDDDPRSKKPAAQAIPDGTGGSG
jgi:hypothetical protein